MRVPAVGVAPGDVERCEVLAVRWGVPAARFGTGRLQRVQGRSGLAGCLVGHWAAVTLSPCHDSGALPNLAHLQRDLRSGEVRPADELLDALPAEAAEHPADLSRSHEVMHGGNHSRHASSHLTMGQEYGRVVT